MSNDVAIDDETEEFFYDLVASTLDEDEILQFMSEGLWYRTLLMAKTTGLTDDEKALLINTDHVDWAKLSADILLAFAMNRATTLNNAASRTKKFTAAKLQIIDAFQESCFPEDMNVDDDELTIPQLKKLKWRRVAWKSALRAMAIDFARILEEGTMRERPKLNEEIHDILKKEWAPADQASSDVMYYIAGAMLNTINNLSKQKKGDISAALKYFKAHASISKDKAKQDNLPLARVERKEKVSLTYANPSFLEMLLKIESVFYALLKEKKVALFGFGLVGDIAYNLESFVDVLGFSQFLPDTTTNETKLMIFRAIIGSYGNLRGKDVAFKKNAAAASNQEQTLRAKLAVSSALAKEKRTQQKKTGKRKREGEGEKEEGGTAGMSNPNATENEATGMATAAAVSASGTNDNNNTQASANAANDGDDFGFDGVSDDELTSMMTQMDSVMQEHILDNE